MHTCHHYHRIHPRMRGVRLPRAAGFPRGTLSPAQVLTAYGFKQNQFAGAAPLKIGVGSLGGGVVQVDVANIAKAWSMPAPKITVRTVGGASADPNSDQDSNVENMLDLEIVCFTWWWLTGTPADVTITFGPNATNGMKLVTDDLVAAGVKVASWSWGSAESSWDTAERDALAASFKAAAGAGVTFCAASGDNSVDDGTGAPSPDYPASDPCVWGVGGTKLEIAVDGSRSRESAWGDGAPGDEGGGGGFDPIWAQPPYQRGIVNVPPSIGPCRGVPDTSANADPNSGWQISANGSWTVVGGTSAASPFTAALIAVAKAAGKVATGLVTPNVYASRRAACNDITIGSNGDPTTSGWDPATGLGSPNGGAFVSAITGAAAPSPPAPSPPVPTPPQPPAPNPPPTVPAPPEFDEYDALSWAAFGIVENWPEDGSSPSLSDLQAWAAEGLAEGYGSRS